MALLLARAASLRGRSAESSWLCQTAAGVIRRATGPALCIFSHSRLRPTASPPAQTLHGTGTTEHLPKISSAALSFPGSWQHRHHKWPLANAPSRSAGDIGPQLRQAPRPSTSLLEGRVNGLPPHCSRTGRLPATYSNTQHAWALLHPRR